MNAKDQQKNSGAPSGRPEPAVRPAFRLALIGLLAVGTLAGVAVYLKQRSANSAALKPAPGAPSEEELPTFTQAGAPIKPVVKESTVIDVAAKTPSYPGPTAAIRPSVPQPEPNPQSRQLVASLSRLDQLGRSMTAEQAADWKQNLQQLVQQGKDGVPAIAEFLKQNKDVDFGSGVKQALGYDSLRRAMFDALAQIGGPEAVLATQQTLQNSADPREIALLAQTLDKMEPEGHREEAVQAAREALALAASGKLEGVDVAPLFEVMAKYGGPSAASELEQATAKWRYYATIALAQLPDGGGIPSLIQMAQDPKAGSGVRSPALEMLAQLASQSPEARAALLEQARLNSISSYTWHAIAPILAGDQVGLLNSEFESRRDLANVGGLRTTHLSSGNQNFYSLPGDLSADQINQRSALIDELLSVNSDPAARDALQLSRDLLARRLQKSVAATPSRPL